MLVKKLILVLPALTAAAPEASYDYIIVGGGTAGLALATRLSRSLPKTSILVIEAGNAAPDELRINVPGMRGSGLGSIYDWNFSSVPQEALSGRSISVNRGKVLGGSSALNYLCYDRASSAEYDAWGQLGNVGWNWNTMIAAMIQSENFTGNDGDNHGRSGPIRTTYNRVIPWLLNLWQPTMRLLGIPINDGGSLGGNPIGAMFQPTNIDTTHWNRSYSANSYLPLAGPNLIVRTGVQVVKLDFAAQAAGQLLHATGVVLEDGTHISASREVILSAGSIGSPALLEVSGIGQPMVLQAAGITPLVNLSGVGENYQDHLRLSNSFKLKADLNITTFDPLIYDSGSQLSADQLQLWLGGETSLFDYTSIAYSFLNWAQVTGNVTAGSLLQLAESSVGSNASALDRKLLEYLHNPSIPQLEIILEANYLGSAAYAGGKYLTLISAFMHPFSRGSSHIDPSAPLGKPIINPQYLSRDYDARALLEAIKFTRQIAQTQPLALIIDFEFEPGPSVQTDEQLLAFVRRAADTFYHPTGTCAMLPREDGGVVDASLVVYGTTNVRVVDVSIFPLLLSGHPQTAAYGVAEVAAGIIARSAVA